MACQRSWLFDFPLFSESIGKLSLTPAEDGSSMKCRRSVSKATGVLEAADWESCECSCTRLRLFSKDQPGFVFWQLLNCWNKNLKWKKIRKHECDLRLLLLSGCVIPNHLFYYLHVSGDDAVMTSASLNNMWFHVMQAKFNYSLACIIIAHALADMFFLTLLLSRVLHVHSADLPARMKWLECSFSSDMMAEMSIFCLVRLTIAFKTNTSFNRSDCLLETASCRRGLPVTSASISHTHTHTHTNISIEAMLSLILSDTAICVWWPATSWLPISTQRLEPHNPTPTGAQCS